MKGEGWSSDVSCVVTATSMNSRGMPVLLALHSAATPAPSCHGERAQDVLRQKNQHMREGASPTASLLQVSCQRATSNVPVLHARSQVLKPHHQYDRAEHLRLLEGLTLPLAQPYHGLPS
jgi:hypothetical protein